MSKKVVRKLIEVELRLGFLHIPAAGVELMPAENTKVEIALPEGMFKLSYNSQHKRLFGLTKWYKKHKLKVGDEVILEKTGQHYSLTFKPATNAEMPAKASENLLDLSGLSTQAKGDIVEDRIKELIVLQGQGLLSVYRPVTDTQGIDLVITKSGIYQPIFLQVKGRYNVQKQGFFLMDISKKTCSPHHSYFVLGAYFNPEKIEIHDYLLLVPSEELVKEKPLETKNGPRYRVMNYLNPQSKGKWAKYLVKKTNLVNTLMEKFEEMNKYIK